MKWILMLLCLFVIGDYVYINGADAHPKNRVVDVYTNTKGSCVYLLYMPKSTHVECCEEYEYGNYYHLRKENELVSEKDFYKGGK